MWYGENMFNEMSEIAAVKQTNFNTVCNYVKLSAEPVTGKEIAENTAVSYPTAKRMLELGEGMGLFLRGEMTEQSMGRKSHIYTINRKYRYYLLAVIEDGRFSYRIFDFKDKVVESDAYKLTVEKSVSELEKTIVEAKKKYNNLYMAGVVIPCWLRDGFVIEWYVNKSVVGHNLKTELSEKFGIDIYLLNDMKSLALSNEVKSDKDKIISAFKCISGSLGYACIINGSIFEGNSGFAGELYPIFNYLKIKDVNNISVDEMIILCSFIITLNNPEKLFIYIESIYFNEKDFFNKISNILPAEALPQFIYKSQLAEDEFNGLHRYLCEAKNVRINNV